MPTRDFTPEALEDPRTRLALMRNRLAADRTLMAWIRTAISMISFGFTIHKFLQYVQGREGKEVRVEGARNLGLSLILLGTGGLVAASLQHVKVLRLLDPGKTKPRWSLSLTIAAAMSLIGLFAFLSVLLKAGPF